MLNKIKWFFRMKSRRVQDIIMAKVLKYPAKNCTYKTTGFCSECEGCYAYRHYQGEEI